MHREHRIIPLARHGAHLIERPHGTSVVRMRSGRFAVLGSVSEGVADALADTTAQIAAPDGGARDDARRLGAELDARDALDDIARWPVARRKLCLMGAGGLLDELASALRGWGVDVTRCAAGATPPDDAALVLAYADTTAQRAGWEQLDALPQRGVAWLRVYREGECVFIDPLAVTCDDATSEQVSRRRLAASPIPDEIEAWQRDASTIAPTMDAATTALTLARLLRVLLAWAQDSASLATLRLTLWKLVPATATVTEHVVLGYPEAPRSVRR